VTEFRKGQSKRHRLATVLGVALFVRWAKTQPLVRERTYPKWREWNCGHHWHMIHQVTQPP
jgi:hypothetical protein